jgi:hypothetical protein
MFGLMGKCLGVVESGRAETLAKRSKGGHPGLSWQLRQEESLICTLLCLHGGKLDFSYSKIIQRYLAVNLSTSVRAVN